MTVAVKIKKLLLTAFLVVGLCFAVPHKAYAVCCGTDGCVCSAIGHFINTQPLMDVMVHGGRIIRISPTLFSIVQSVCLGSPACAAAALILLSTGREPGTAWFIRDLIRRYKDWVINDFFLYFIRPAILGFTQQLTATGMAQVLAVGLMLDAKEQLETQRVIERMTAQAHKDYRPAWELCTFGTAARGLASSERNAQMNAQVLSRLALDRQLGSVNTRASASAALDRNSRLRTFKEQYCDPRDNNNGLASVCLTPANGREDRINRDVDFTRTVSMARTLPINFSDTFLHDNETDLVALGEYLYGHNIPKRLTTAILKVPGNQDEYLDWRSIVAKRSVAQNSYNSIVGMKTAGNGDLLSNTIYVAAVFKQLGIPQPEAEYYLAPGGQPSYYALMEILGQKIYQDDTFYTNLYDTPVNVKRKDVAMQAIGLMVDRDSYHSELRYESMLSVLLEMELIKYQRAVQNRLAPLKGGKP